MHHGGVYTHPATGEQFPRLQVITIAELLAGKRPSMPPTALPYIAALKTVAAASTHTHAFRLAVARERPPVQIPTTAAQFIFAIVVALPGVVFATTPIRARGIRTADVSLSSRFTQGIVAGVVLDLK